MHTYIKHIPRCKQVMGGMPLKKGLQLAASGSSSCMHPSRMDGSIPCMMEACIVAWHMGWKYVSFFFLLRAFIPGPAYSLQAGRREKANDKRDRSALIAG